MTTIALQFWAGARAAAGVPREEWAADSVADAIQMARKSRNDTHFDRVVAMCSILVDGVVASADDLSMVRTSPVVAELLPPFAGG